MDGHVDGAAAGLGDLALRSIDLLAVGAAAVRDNPTTMPGHSEIIADQDEGSTEQKRSSLDIWLDKATPTSKGYTHWPPRAIVAALAHTSTRPGRVAAALS